MSRSAENADARTLNRAIGERIKGRRIVLGLSQTALADQLGVTYQQVQKFEHGRNSASAFRLQQLAVALDVSVHWLMTGQGKVAVSKGTDRPALDLQRRLDQSPPWLTDVIFAAVDGILRRQAPQTPRGPLNARQHGHNALEASS